MSDREASMAMGAPAAGLPLPARPAGFRAAPSAAERQQGLERYLAFLRARNGAASFAEARLERREIFFEELASRRIRWKGPLDRDAFHRNLDRRPEAGLDPRVLWLLAAGKANQSERYAVDLILESGELREGYGDHSELMFLEEVYHTRILYEACRTCGIEFEMSDPPAVMRVFIRALESVSDRVNLPLSYCGELIGVVLFDLLREEARAFDEEPEVAERLRSLAEQIMVDELGHLVFCQWKLGRAGVAVSRALLPLIAIATLSHAPEFVRLAGGRRELLRRILDFDPSDPPARIREAAERAADPQALAVLV